MRNLSLRKHIRDIKEATKIGWESIEQDYVLSWVLFGISKVEKLRSTLIFKGGTALKKCYFGDYRFSQDLDFSVQGDHPRGDDLLFLIGEACRFASDTADTLEFLYKRYPERAPHPEEQEAFDIRARLPWQRDFLTNVKVEVTTREQVLLKPAEKAIIHGYGENLDGTILTYQLEEIIAEKMRAILQFAKKLHERGWARSRVRDYYDLWRILGDYGEQIDKAILPALVNQKCENKSITFQRVDDLFEVRLIEHLIEWERWLSPVMPNLPKKDIVISELRMQLKGIFEEQK